MSKDEGVLIGGGGPHDCRSVANKIINSRLAEGLPVTHMQVQALVYLCHSWMLALYSESLLAQPIRAFSCGTFLPDLWDSLCRYGDLPVRRPIDLPSVGVKEREYDHLQERVIRRVLEEYGDLSERRLYGLVNGERTPSDLAISCYKRRGVDGLVAIAQRWLSPSRVLKEYPLGDTFLVSCKQAREFYKGGFDYLISESVMPTTPDRLIQIYFRAYAGGGVLSDVKRHRTCAGYVVDFAELGIGLLKRSVGMKKVMFSFGALVLSASVGLGCNTDVAPKTCVQLVEEAGAPGIVVDYMRRPIDSLNVFERIAIRTALNELGLGDACDAMRESLSED